MKASSSMDLRPHSTSVGRNLRGQRSRSTDRAAEMRFLRDSGLLGQTSATGSVIIHSDLSSAMTSPRLFDQYTLHTALAEWVDPSGLSMEVKAAFISVSRRRETRLLTEVFKELRLETVVGRLADSFYQNNLKFRLFRVLIFANRVPRALNYLYQVLFSQYWRRYKKTTKRLTATSFAVNIRKKRVFAEWIRFRAISSFCRHSKTKKTMVLFIQWRSEVRIQLVLRKYSKKTAAKILLEWHVFAQKIGLLRVSFSGLKKYITEKRVFRLSNSIRFQAISEKLNENYRIRVCGAVLNALKEGIKQRFSSYVQSSVRLYNYRLEIAKVVLNRWRGYINRNIEPSILGRKVFRAWRITLVQKRNRMILGLKVSFRVKNRFFSEWIDLFRSGNYIKIRSAEDFRLTKTAKTAISALSAYANEGKYKAAISVSHARTLYMKLVWASWFNFHTNNRSSRYFKAFQNHRKSIFFSTWKSFAATESLFHEKVWLAINRERKKKFVFIWRKAALLSQMNDDQLVGSFRIRTRLQQSFTELKEGVYRKRLIQMHRKKVKRLLFAWKEVVDSLKYYQNRAFRLSVPARLRSKKSVWREEETQSKRLRQFVVKKATKVIAYWVQESRLQRRLRALRKSVKKRIKSFCFAQIFTVFYNKYRKKMSIAHHQRHCGKSALIPWKKISQVLTAIREKEENVVDFLRKTREKRAINQLKIRLTKRKVDFQYINLGLKQWAATAMKKTIKMLFLHAKSHFSLKFLKEKLLLLKRPVLIWKGLQSFKVNHYFHVIIKKLRFRMEKTVKKRCFSAFENHVKMMGKCREHRKKIAWKLSSRILREWKDISSVSSSLKRNSFDTAIFIAKTNLKPVFSWIAEEFHLFATRKRTLSCFKDWKETRKGNREKTANFTVLLIRQRTTSIIKRWRLFSLQKSFQKSQKATLSRLSISRLSRHRKIRVFLRNKRKREELPFFFAWKNESRTSSIDALVSIPCDSHFLIRLQMSQVFAAWKRKSGVRKKVGFLVREREGKALKATWTLLRRLKDTLRLERERNFQIRKDLVLELKCFFKQNRLSLLFRQQKLALKSLKAWRLEAVTASASRQYGSDNVFLYLPKEEAEKVEELLANESSLIDQKQIDLENELSMLTFQLETAEKKRVSAVSKPVPLGVIKQTVTGKIPDTAKRRVKETEQIALQNYVQYRHSMRTMDRSQRPMMVFNVEKERGVKAESPERAERHRRVTEVIQRSQRRNPPASFPAESSNSDLHLSDLEEKRPGFDPPTRE